MRLQFLIARQPCECVAVQSKAVVKRMCLCLAPLCRSLSSPEPRLPLRDLARSCKLLAQEIRDHSQSLSATERYATIHIKVDADENKHDYSLAHVICPAKDLTALRIVYNISISSLYWADNFPQFHDLVWRLLDPDILYDLPTALDVQVFCHMRPDTREPPLESLYNSEMNWTREVLAHYPDASRIAPKVLRLMEFTLKPWKSLPTAG